MKTIKYFDEVKSKSHVFHLGLKAMSLGLRSLFGYLYVLWKERIHHETKQHVSDDTGRRPRLTPS